MEVEDLSKHAREVALLALVLEPGVELLSELRLCETRADLIEVALGWAHEGVRDLVEVVMELVAQLVQALCGVLGRVAAFPAAAHAVLPTQLVMWCQ